jgi:opacity protein-like surface antigen
LTTRVDATGNTDIDVSRANEFMFQFTGGMGYRITPRFGIAADYRYLHSTDYRFTSSSGVSREPFSAHSLNLNLIYSFA